MRPSRDLFLIIDNIKYFATFILELLYGVYDTYENYSGSKQMLP